jgi:hypothetical protein
VTAYLTRAAFKLLTVMPAVDVDALETEASGWVDAQLALVSARIDSRLRKRYTVPFTSPYPAAVTDWLARLVTLQCYLRRGVDSTDAQFVQIKADADAATAELKEAADAKEGLFELPLRADTDADGVTRGGPLAYSEQSPYVWTNSQGTTGREEDASGSGTGD